MIDNKWQLIQLLQLRRDRRWRDGLLRGALSFGIINQGEWDHLVKQVERGKPCPSLPRQNLHWRKTA